jgi:hypothetical protein
LHHPGTEYDGPPFTLSVERATASVAGGTVISLTVSGKIVRRKSRVEPLCFRSHKLLRNGPLFNQKANETVDPGDVCSRDRPQPEVCPGFPFCFSGIDHDDLGVVATHGLSHLMAEDEVIIIDVCSNHEDQISLCDILKGVSHCGDPDAIIP